MYFGLWREIARDLKEQGILDVLEIDVGESSLSDARTECIDMVLGDRERLKEEIVACREEVDVEDSVVGDGAEDTLIVADCVSWEEGNADSRVGFRFDSAFGFRKHEDAGIRVSGRVELELRWQLALVVDCQQT